jgi:hypothetical protein
LARDPIAVAARCETNGECLNLRERIVPGPTKRERERERRRRSTAPVVREWSAARHVAAGEPETRSGRRQVIDLQILGLQLRRDGSAARSPVAPPMDRGVSVLRFSRFAAD